MNEKQKLTISGMTCATCSATVEKAVNDLPGVKASVNLTTETLSFEILEELACEIIRSVPGIVSVTYNIASKPPSTIEAV